MQDSSPNSYPQQVPPNPPAQNMHPPHQPKKNRVWLGIVAVVLGVLGLICIGVGGPETRIAFISVGIILSIAGVVLALVAFAKRWGKGLFIAAAIVSGFALVVNIGFMGLALFSLYYGDKRTQQAAEEHQQYLEEQQAAKDEILKNSAWVEELRESVVPEDFIDVDADTLNKIVEDPDSYIAKAFEVEATHAAPLISDTYSEQGLCLVEVSLAPVGSNDGIDLRAVVVDRGTEDECPLADRMLGISDENGDVGESFATNYRMQLTPFTTISANSDDELASFVLLDIVE